MSLIGVSMSSLPSLPEPEQCPARYNLTMKNCKPSSILANTLQCLAASIITGAIEDFFWNMDVGKVDAGS